MALRVNKDMTTEIELEGMYFRIDKINFNHKDFQVTATGYASEQAYKNGAQPVANTKYYTFENYDKKELEQSNVFAFAYKMLKETKMLQGVEDVFEEGQRQ